jgi:hypothetical protein
MNNNSVRGEGWAEILTLHGEGWTELLTVCAERGGLNCDSAR